MPGSLFLYSLDNAFKISYTNGSIYFGGKK